MVIEEQAEPQYPGRTQAFVMRQDKPQRPDDVRRLPEQHFTLNQGFPHQPEFVVLQIAQPAMDELCGGRRCRASKVALLQEQHFQAAAGSVARDGRAVDAAADYRDIVERLCHHRHSRIINHQAHEGLAQSQQCAALRGQPRGRYAVAPATPAWSALAAL